MKQSIDKVKRKLYAELSEQDFKRFKFDYEPCTNCDQENNCEICLDLLQKPMTRKDLQVHQLLLQGVSEDVILNLNSEKSMSDHIQLKQFSVNSIAEVERLNDEEFTENDLSDNEYFQLTHTPQEVEIKKKLGIYDKLEKLIKQRRKRPRTKKQGPSSRIIKPKDDECNFEEAFDFVFAKDENASTINTIEYEECFDENFTEEYPYEEGYDETNENYTDDAGYIYDDAGYNENYTDIYDVPGWNENDQTYDSEYQYEEDQTQNNKPDYETTEFYEYNDEIM
jgi:hypothetical protein